MLVRDLLEVLEQCNPNAVVVIATDPNGSSFSTVEEYASGFFDSAQSEFITDEELDNDVSDDDSEWEDEDDDDTPRSIGKEAVAIYPAY